MSLYFTSLNSGSNGNSYYVGNEKEAVLVDAGIACSETEKRMQRLGLPMQNIKAIFISHEHSDHIRGIPLLAKRYGLPVYVSAGTQRHCRLVTGAHPIYQFTASEPVQIGSLTITSFPKLHDAADPHSFVITGQNINVGVFTDIGAPCAQLKKYFSKCHAAFLESNYDEAMLDKGRYPQHLKNRIRGGYGHLSNRQALQFFLDHKPPFLQHLVLAHLSNENNCPDLVQRLFSQQSNGTDITVASRYKETPLFSVTHPSSQHGNMLQLPKAIETPVQMSLF